MRRRVVTGGLAAALSIVALATPVSAHGDHDARPVARRLTAGPYIVSLWQVYPDTGVAMKPHLIVMFDDRASAPSEAVVTAAVNSMPMAIGPSITTANGWETMDGIAEGDVVSVSVSDGSQAMGSGSGDRPADADLHVAHGRAAVQLHLSDARDRTVVGPKSCPSVANPSGPGELTRRPFLREETRR